ncbi:efflux RND transporter periplasmic adaptor subunit [Methyloceanibacter sp. wino2]|uniref:efflux RND transporter periplasmic adaptor subunit n=1 Tax=Methyloceanibacter sp. wino2 TaxID=2170729 RepID=UPI000D3EB9D5|nr:efflux RND transporter periplasmic adaptor subunit [Methyloceanibacter sp. wino2]
MTLRKVVPGLLILVGILLAVAWLSGWFEEKSPPGETEAARGDAPSNAETAVVERVAAPAVEWASGAVESARRTTVAARILARIEDMNVVAGDEVAEGDLLATLDARDLLARVKQAQEALKAGEAERDLARQELARTEQLLERGVSTQQRFDQAVSNLRVAEAQVDRLKQDLSEAQTALSFTEILAPVAGRVVDRLAEPGDTITPGQPLLRLYDPLALRVEAPVRESLALGLKTGDVLRVDIPALQDTLSGQIDEIVPYAEPGARTLLVKVRLPSDARALAGMFARIAVPAGERARLLVPADAVKRIGQLELVTVVRDGQMAQRMVTTGQPTNDARIEILSGLKEGERVMR